MPGRIQTAMLIAAILGIAAVGAFAEDSPQPSPSLAELKSVAAEADALRSRAADEVSMATEQVNRLDRELIDLQRELKQTRQSLESAQEQLKAATADWVSKEQAVEDVLRESGEWVSFAEEIAPVFHERCVACHNTRAAKGRLDMETYTSLMKGGESGAVVDPGDGEDSYLCLLIDDASMPKDAEPLTQEQVALIKRWVELGAPLDAGADANEKLIRIMPKPQQPPAPVAYNVPIPVTAVAFSPDGSLLATSGYHEVLLWSTSDGGLVRRIGNIAERVSDLDFHPDGDRLAIAAGTPGQLGETLIVRVSDGTLAADLVTAEDAMLAVAFSPDGTRLAACGADRSIRLFDVETGKQQTLIEDHADWVMDIAWSPDGTKLASASRDKTSKLFDAQTGNGLETFNNHGDVVYGVAFLPDGKMVATCGRDKKVRLWALEEAKQKREIGGFGSDVFKVIALADGRLLSCGADNSAQLHTSADGKLVRKFAGHSDWVYAVAAHPQSARLATGSYDGEVRLWNLDTGEAVLTFKAAPGLQQVSADASE